MPKHDDSSVIRGEKTSRPARSERGISLLEMMVLVAVIGILVASGRIGIQAFVKGQRLRAASSTVRGQLITARTRALANPSVHCGIYVDTANSLTRLFFDEDGDNIYDNPGDILFSAEEKLFPGLKLVIDDGDSPITDQVIIFRGDGSAKNGGRFSIQFEDNANQKRTFDVLASTGRIKVIR